MKSLIENIVSADRRIKNIDGGVCKIPSEKAGEFINRTGTTFLMKGEHLQRTGSFKMRDAMNMETFRSVLT